MHSAGQLVLHIKLVQEIALNQVISRELQLKESFYQVKLQTKIATDSAYKHRQMVIFLIHALVLNTLPPLKLVL